MYGESHVIHILESKFQWHPPWKIGIPFYPKSHKIKLLHDPRASAFIRVTYENWLLYGTFLKVTLLQQAVTVRAKKETQNNPRASDPQKPWYEGSPECGLVGMETEKEDRPRWLRWKVSQTGGKGRCGYRAVEDISEVWVVVLTYNLPPTPPQHSSVHMAQRANTTIRN